MGIAVQADQLEQIDFSYPILMSPFRMIVPAAQEKSRLFAFTRPFQPLVWLSFFISLIASIVAKSFITWLYKRWDLKRQPSQQLQATVDNKTFIHYLSYYIMYTIAIITAHGSTTIFILIQNVIVKFY
jgi:small-conductance mechanosensitive channel